jgi:3-hydroxyacyl-CoA dehydrogenase/enoyl-CoA hydratase/3-hydroxybutyryl-CoA epimerase
MAFRLERDKDKIVSIYINSKNSSDNLVNESFVNSLKDTLFYLRSNLSDIDGIILRSTNDTFHEGIDINHLLSFSSNQSLFKYISQCNSYLFELESLKVPIVAAINGSALGGGLEIALCCHYRIVIENSKTRLGFPDIKYGMIPPLGGIVRATRSIGFEIALKLLSTGKLLNTKQALEYGLVDQLCSDSSQLIHLSKKWIRENKEKFSTGEMRIVNRVTLDSDVLEKIPILPAIIRNKTFGNYPAQEAILNVATESFNVDFKTAIRIGIRSFIKLVNGKVFKNLIETNWHQLNEIRLSKKSLESSKGNRIKRVGIIGAGMMGHGIAYVTASSDIEVVLIDKSMDILDIGKSRIIKILEKEVKLNNITSNRSEQILLNISFTTNYSRLKDCDLVIEAVTENRKIKKEIIETITTNTNSKCVIASNTSTLPISSLADYTNNKKNFIGIHFFSPVQKMKLVEIIVGNKTSNRIIKIANDYAHQINKIPIVVNDSRGFYTSRCFSTYLNEGLNLLAEGNPPQLIEMAGLKAGMPVGPLALIDEISLTLVANIKEQTQKDLKSSGITPTLDGSDAVIKLMTGKLERKGKLDGAGFYEYPKGGKKYLWPSLKDYFELSSEPEPIHNIIDRLIFVQVLETLRCIEEEVITSVADANIGSIYGWGFPSFYGGTIQFINDYGLKKFIARTKELSISNGKRFIPPNILNKNTKEKVFLIK